MYSLGIDSGSTTTKGILYDGENIVAKYITKTGSNPRRSIKEVYDNLYSEKVKYTVTTGYGRKLLQEADKNITEITCHAQGAAYLNKDVKTVIDIGGQDSKVILLDRDNNVMDFLMNDKCAAGTGRFVEVIMGILEEDIENIDEIVKGKSPVNITSMCTVFAESEVISLLCQDIDKGDIALGIIDSIVNRTANFSKRLNIEDEIFFSGGLARYSIFRELLSQKLNMKVNSHELGQFAGAIGAAVIGARYIS